MPVEPAHRGGFWKECSQVTCCKSQIPAVCLLQDKSAVAVAVRVQVQLSRVARSHAEVV